MRAEGWLSACQPICLHTSFVAVCWLSAGCLRAVCSCLLFKSAVCGCCPLLSASCQLLSAHQPSVAVCAVRQPSGGNVHLKASTKWWGMKPPCHALVHSLLVLANLPHPKQAGAGLGNFWGHGAGSSLCRVFSHEFAQACKACLKCPIAPPSLTTPTPP